MTVPRLRRADPLDILHHISEIGPRRATSLGEAQTAAYVDSWLRRAGLSVGADTFRAATSLGWTYPALAAIGVSAVLLSFWLIPFALIAALFGLMFALTDALSAPLPPLARFRDSQNVVATRPRIDSEDPTLPQPRWRVVLLAPLDTPVHSGRFRMYTLTGRQAGALIGRIIAFGLLLLLLLLLLVDPRSLWQYALVLPALYLVFTVLPLTGRSTSQAQQGSAGALATLLTTVERLGALYTVELWAVAVGATATGSDGLQNLLNRYPFDLEKTLFLSLEYIDTGHLVLASHEGLLRQHTADPLLLHLASEISTHPEGPPVTVQPYQSAASVANPLHARNYRVLTLFSQPGPGITEPHDHATGDDNPLEPAVQLLVALIRLLDQDNGQTPDEILRQEATPFWNGSERRRGERRRGERRRGEHQLGERRRGERRHTEPHDAPHVGSHHEQP